MNTSNHKDKIERFKALKENFNTQMSQLKSRKNELFSLFRRKLEEEKIGMTRKSIDDFFNES